MSRLVIKYKTQPPQERPDDYDRNLISRLVKHMHSRPLKIPKSDALMLNETTPKAENYNLFL